MVMGINETVWSPFLPTVFAQNDISESTTGVVVAAYEVSYLVSSLLFMTVTNVDHRRITFCLFSVAAGIFIIIFGQLIFINSFEVFVATSILLRCLVGFAVGIYFCSGTSLLFSIFPNDTGKVLSYVSMAASLGFIIGTPFGSFFFSFGCYCFPFLAAGLLQIFLSVITFFVLPNKTSESTPKNPDSGKFMEEEVSEPTCRTKLIQDENRSNLKLSVLDFVKNKVVICLSISVTSTTTSIGFVFVSFGPFLLSQFGLSKEEQGLCFLPFTITRAVIAPVFGYFTDNGYGVLSFTVFGCILSSFSLVLLAIPGYFNFVNNLIYVELVLVITGVGSSAALVSFAPLLRKCFEESGKEKSEQINSYMSALYSVCYGLGVTIGEALYGGYILQKLGFFNSCLVQFVICAVGGSFGTIYLIKNQLV